MRKRWFLLFLVPIIYLLLLFFPILNTANERNCNGDSDCALASFCGQYYSINKFSSATNTLSQILSGQTIFPGTYNCPLILATDNFPGAACINNQCSIKLSPNCSYVCNSTDSQILDQSAGQLNTTATELLIRCGCKQ